MALTGLLFIYVTAGAPVAKAFNTAIFTMLPKTASTVVGLISGKILQISALEIGVNEFKTVASIRAFW